MLLSERRTWRGVKKKEHGGEPVGSLEWFRSPPPQRWQTAEWDGWMRTCMLLPVTARIVHPTCVKTVMVGSQKSADRTRRTKGRFEETFFQ